MKKLFVIILLFILLGFLSACSNNAHVDEIESTDNKAKIEINKTDENSEIITDNKFMDTKEDYRIKISVAGIELSATLYNNPTAEALVEKLPMTVKMNDLYNREMAYFFPDELPTDKVEITGYEVGEIIYWPPRNTLVIMYAQNGEKFGMQKVGMIDSGVDVFESTGDTEVLFELID